MAGVFQKFASGMWRSTSRLSAHASASARAIDPIILRASEAGIRNNSNVFHGAAVQPGTVFPNDCAIHGYTTRYLSTLPWSRAAAKAGWPTTGVPPTVVKKPTFLVSFGGMKRTFSSGAPNKLGHSWVAKLAAWNDRRSVWRAERLGEDDAGLSRTWIIIVFISPFIGYWLVTSSPPAPRDYGHGLSGCSGCCHCLAGGSKS